MEDEDAEMAKAIAKSEEEEEQRLQSELRREGEGGGGWKKYVKWSSWYTLSKVTHFHLYALKHMIAYTTVIDHGNCCP